MRPRAQGVPSAAGSRGFTLVWLLFFLATLGVGLAAVGQLWRQAAQREQERELLFIGDEFRRAIGAYYESSPGIKHYPRRLEQLLADDRVPGVRRHLRRIYRDPMTGQADWSLIMQGDQILGVHSRSTGQPIKRANFPVDYAFFAESLGYSDWRFVYTPRGSPSAGAAALAADREILAGREQRQAEALATPMNVSGASGPGGGTEAAAAPATDYTVGFTSEGWMCTATRANDMRACEQSATGLDQEAFRQCRQAAWQRYQRCLATSTGGAQPSAGQ
jgi:type II secretory pathway pseudopilin PulG